jgi:CRP-like cAMP-binding protein
MSDGGQTPGRMTGIERAIALRGVEAFRSVPMDELAHVAAVAREERHRAGQVLFREGEASGGLLVVLSGTVRLERGGAAAGEARAGETLGTWSLFDDHPRRATAVAATDVRLLVLDRDAFFDVLSERIEIVRSLFRDLVRRLVEPATGAGGGGG